MINKITDIDNMYDALRKTRRGKHKHKQEAVNFRANETYNLLTLRNAIAQGKYTPAGYKRFYVFEPKRRLIYAPTYRDKIVQHAINNVLRDELEPKFSPYSFACIRNKGHLAALQHIKDIVRKARQTYGDDFWVLHLDIKRFFYTICRNILKRILKVYVLCKHTLALIYKILDNSPEPRGIPLGNLLSQILANLYLHILDMYVTRKLGVRYYMRYADDILILHKGKKEVDYLEQVITRYLNDKLDLKINKTKTQKHLGRHGVACLGFKIGSKIHTLSRVRRKAKRQLESLNLSDPRYWNKRNGILAHLGKADYVPLLHTQIH